MIKKVKLRSLLIGGVFTLVFVFLIGRLYWVQVVQGEETLALAQMQWETDRVLQPVRGSILDRGGRVLAEDAPAFTVALSPVILRELGLELDAARGLASILKLSDDPMAQALLEEKIRTRLNRTRPDGRLYAQVEIGNEGWKIDASKADEIKQLIEQLKVKANTKKSVGIILMEEHKRYYPGGDLAVHLLGYSNKEGVPVMGLEKQLDEELKGELGFLRYGSDPRGVELPDTNVKYQPAVNGNNVKLTIDKNIQFYMDNALKKVYEKFTPKSLTAIAIDPKTMEILGISNYPNFDPNKYWEMNSNSTVNHAVASQYEPGSTMKIIPLAAAVEEGFFRAEDQFQSGSIRVPGAVLHDHNTIGWGKISYLEGLLRSSNVAFVKLGYEMLGKDKLKQYFERFGFGARTGIDLPGEAAGIVNMRYDAEYATATYGQGMTATALQQTVAYAAIANGGMLMKPYIVKETIHPETNEIVSKNEPQAVRRVVSEVTAKKVSELLEQVVLEGTGRKAAVEGYRAAGKTGTANKVVPGVKGYAAGKWVVSFIGYAPVEDPRIVVAVIADEPDLGGNYQLAGEVTSPAFKEIMSQSLRYLGVAPTEFTQAAAMSTAPAALGAVVPELIGLPLEQARQTAGSGVALIPIGSGDTVISQTPAPGSEMAASQRIFVVTEEERPLQVPDLTGLSLRDAAAVCALIQLQCSVQGEGYIVKQSLTGEGTDAKLALILRPPNRLDEALEDEAGDSAASEETGESEQEADGASAQEDAEASD